MCILKVGSTRASLRSGVISISAIRACGAAAFDDGRKKLKFSKAFFFPIFFLQIFVNCFK